jgi:UDP-N-acetylmuramyl pentapeptide phosphotransferase/UDP-N-acetylglucosamine-1-phosphate transferase
MLIIVFLTSFFVVLVSTPSIIKVAKLKHLFDEPTEERKLHKRRIPTIGGIIIFAATLFSFSLWFPVEDLNDYTRLFNAVVVFKYLLATLLILFFVGVKDDIIGTAAIKKLIANLLVAMIMVLLADVRLTGLHGILGITQIPYGLSVFLSIMTYIVVINAFNLIDGVDGLAAGIGLIVATAFGFWFLIAGQIVMASLAFALGGSLLGFLMFNYNPARIFMGDSGSLTIGLIVAVLCIRLIEFDKVEIKETILDGISKPVFVVSVLIFPLIDTLRIFIYRAVRGISPFEADRNHIHHRLLDLGFSHKQTVMILYGANIFMIIVAIALKDVEPSYSLMIVGGIAALLSQLPFLAKIRQEKKMQSREAVAK